MMALFRSSHKYDYQQIKNYIEKHIKKYKYSEIEVKEIIENR